MDRRYAGNNRRVPCLAGRGGRSAHHRAGGGHRSAAASGRARRRSRFRSARRDRCGSGPALDRVPLRPVQLAIGVLLLLFGMRWLRKAILRAAGLVPLHDETTAYARETAELRGGDRRHGTQRDWFAMLVSFKAVVLEGLEVVFIVIAVGAGRGMTFPASLGALAACVLVAGAGFAIHRPLARVPENTLKFAVGIMLSAFGVFWIGKASVSPGPAKISR